MWYLRGQLKHIFEMEWPFPGSQEGREEVEGRRSKSRRSNSPERLCTGYGVQKAVSQSTICKPGSFGKSFTQTVCQAGRIRPRNIRGHRLDRCSAVWGGVCFSG